jgi:PAS domain S-box-containing protein
MLNFQTLFEGIPGLYFVLTPDYAIVGASDAYLLATKRKREEIIGRKLFEVFPDNPDDPNATGVRNLRASIESVLKYRKPHTMAVQKYDIPRPESQGGGFEERYWSALNSPLFGENGEITHIIHRTEDVTEFVQMQQQRNEQRQINQALQTRSQQMEMEIYLRSQELQELNKQLQTANEALSELDRAKTEFFSNVSHEFRTPLTLMLSPIEDALFDTSSPLPAVQKERLEVVQRNGLRLLKLVNTLLDFSRIEAGRIQATYEPTDLSALTAELASVFRSLIEQAGMQLVVECSALPEAIYVDRQMWEKIIFNLLSNAFKFTLAGRITVRLQNQETDIELTVEDTGIGVPPEELPHLFERFHRVKGSQGRSFEGSGIGLALVQELVKLHGGTVTATSVLGQGSCFKVTIPKGERGSGGAGKQGSREQGDKGTTRQGKNISSLLPFSLSPPQIAQSPIPYVEEAQRWLPTKEGEDKEANSTLSSVFSRSRILLADDNADMRDYVQRLLSSHYIVEAACDGMAALNAIRENPPDLVLSDVMMPKMDGFELLRSLRSDAKTQEIPIILLSARAGEESRIEGLGAGADDYLIKPFSARELLARVESTLKLAKLRQTAKTLHTEAETAKANLESVLANLEDGFVILDRNWCFTYLNDRKAEIWAIHREEAIGKNIWELLPDLVGSELESGLHQVMREQTPMQFEHRDANSNRWFDNRVYPTADGLAIICTDISHRKHSEAGLKESQRRFRRLVESNLFGVVFGDNFGGLHYANEYLLNLVGYTLEEMQSGQAQWHQLTPPEFASLDAKAVEQLSTQGVCAPYEKVYLHKNGQRIPILIAAALLQEPFNENQEVVAFILDLTELQRVTEERDRFFNLSLDMIAIGNFQGYFTQLNPAWERTLGFSETELKAKPYIEFVHPDDRAVTLLEAQKLVQGYQTIGFENRYRTKDGSYRWLYWNVVSLAEQNVFYAAAHDITDRKLTEQTQEQLLLREQAAREAAENANRVKDEFLAVLSHELRTPLSPILGWSKLLQMGKLNAAKSTEAIAIIERNARLQVQLIEDLLDISRILSGKMSLTLMPVDMARVIAAALETVRLAAEAKSLQIESFISPFVGNVNGDPARLQQVVWNLLSNAVKFTPAGGQIAVNLAQMGTYVQIQVKDTGKGINPKFVPYVFEHFRQEDGATTRQFGGLGLGLAIVRQIVEMHGGTVMADSPGEGQGATFTVQIPLFRSAEEMKTLELPKSTPDLNGVKILVVDDDADSRDFISFILEQEKAIVTTVASGFDALQVIEQATPDIVLSDIGMAEMNGYMLMRQLQMRTASIGGIKAIALTAYAGELNQQEALAAGFQRHLAKPVEIDELVQAIGTLVGRIGHGA